MRSKTIHSAKLLLLFVVLMVASASIPSKMHIQKTIDIVENPEQAECLATFCGTPTSVVRTVRRKGAPFAVRDSISDSRKLTDEIVQSVSVSITPWFSSQNQDSHTQLTAVQYPIGILTNGLSVVILLFLATKTANLQKKRP